jgi:hypothetical protein
MQFSDSLPIDFLFMIVDLMAALPWQLDQTRVHSALVVGQIAA